MPLIAYVPPGSVSKGEALARTGNGGKTIACGTCHGSDLKGLGTIPPIAGQSPSYIVRQLYDFQQGTRAGSMSALMKPAVEKLALDDMISLASYLASLEALNRAGGPEFGFGVASRRSAEQNDRSVCDTGADHDRKSNDSTTARSVEHG